MDLSGQNSISIILKKLEKILVLLFIAFLFIGFRNSVYAGVDINKKAEKNKVAVVASNLNNNIENTISSKNIDINNDAVGVYNSNINNIFNINLNGNYVTLLDDTLGLFFLTQNKHLLLEEICNLYIKELDIDSNSITQIQVLGTINNNLYKGRIESLSNSGEISNELYNALVINENLSELEFKISLSEIEDIEPKTITEECNDLYLGETQTIIGVKGKNLVNKEITYKGLSKCNEQILSEKVINPVVNNINKVGTKNPYYDGVKFLSRPIKSGDLTSYFGEVRANKFHKGIDIAESLGKNVSASFNGQVITAGYNNGGYGNLVVIKHDNNMKTYYAHLNDIYVNVGDIVKKDDIIGTVGSTGNSTGPHLHFELRVDNQPVDPVKYIQQ